MTLRYLNLYTSIDDIWTDEKARVCAISAISKDNKARARSLLRFNIIWGAVVLLNAVPLFLKDAAALSIFLQLNIVLMVTVFVIRSYKDYKKTSAQADYYDKMYKAYENDVTLAVIMRATRTTDDKFNVETEYSSAIVTRILDRHLYEGIIRLDKSRRKLHATVDGADIPIAVADIKEGDLDCITVLKDGFFIGVQSNVCMSNITQTLQIDIPIEIVETVESDVLEDLLHDN